MAQQRAGLGEQRLPRQGLGVRGLGGARGAGCGFWWFVEVLAGAAGVPMDQPGARGAMRGHEATRFYTSLARNKQLASWAWLHGADSVDVAVAASAPTMVLCHQTAL